MTEPHALARPFDQSGDVGDGELGSRWRLDRPEHGLQGGERIVGNLRSRIRDATQERRLSGVRHAGEGRIRDELEAQLQGAVAPRKPGLGEPWRLSGGGRKLRVPPPSGAATRSDEPQARPVEIGDELTALVQKLRADRQLEHHGGPVGAMLARAAPVAAAFGL